MRFVRNSPASALMSVVLSLSLSAILLAGLPGTAAAGPTTPEVPVSTSMTLAVKSSSTPVYRVKIQKNKSASLKLRDGISLYIPSGALPAGVVVTARYVASPKTKGSYKAVGHTISFTLSHKATFKKALDLRTPVPHALITKGRFDYYHAAYYSGGTWKTVSSGYDPIKGILHTPMRHFSLWNTVTTIVEITKAIIECGAKAALQGGSGAAFLRCLAPKGFEIAGNELAAQILKRLLPTSCWTALVIADLTSGGKIIGTILGLLGVILDDPACIGKAGDPALATPRITGVSPAHGSTAGGETVTISGSYLFLVKAVTFGGAPATDLQTYMNDASHITARVPAHAAGVVNVVVVAAGGTSPYSGAAQYTYLGSGGGGGGGGGSTRPIPSAAASIGIDWSSTHPGWVSIRLDGFPTGSYTYTCQFASGGDQSFTLGVTAQPQTFDNGRTCYDQISNDQIHVSIDGINSNTLTVGAPPLQAPGGGQISEVTGGPAATWTNYSNAGGIEGPTIPGQASVDISCKIAGFRVADGNTWWYQVASEPWSGSVLRLRRRLLQQRRHQRTASRAHPSSTPTSRTAASPAPPQTTTTETTGGVTHTWTNYSNAGGTQGPSIPAFTSVEITCKLQGFVVADGNPWWYRVASGPWSNSYYASADAFYNNGATSGPLKGTPFVDSEVPDC